MHFCHLYTKISEASRVMQRAVNPAQSIFHVNKKERGKRKPTGSTLRVSSHSLTPRANFILPLPTSERTKMGLKMHNNSQTQKADRPQQETIIDRRRTDRPRPRILITISENRIYPVSPNSAPSRTP
ncbi:hypothetical protein VTN96DRAFT_4888 [Rasamsonia emersonii]